MCKIKSIPRSVKRIQKKYNLTDGDAVLLEHMLESVTMNRDKRIESLNNKIKRLNKKIALLELNWKPTLKKIKGSLKCSIANHGAITPEHIPSTSKTIFNQMLDN
jgi:UDP-glucose 6-dehydrogenase